MEPVSVTIRGAREPFLLGLVGGLRWMCLDRWCISVARELRADVVIVGGGTGGCAAALAALRCGLTVLMTEETGWIGGQFTSQAVPPDENPWVEEYPPTTMYGELRNRVRSYYRRNFPLAAEARRQRYLNPGNGEVGPLCADPRAFLAAIHELLAPYLFTARLVVLHRNVARAVEVRADRIESVLAEDQRTGEQTALVGSYYLDGTDTGELVGASGAEHVVGAEPQEQTGEPHAPDQALPDVMEAFTWAFVCDYQPGVDHTIDRPQSYGHFLATVPTGWAFPQLSWKTLYFDTDGVNLGFGGVPRSEMPWSERRILDVRNFVSGFALSDVACVNAFQNLYLGGPSFGEDAEHHRMMARQLSLCLVYWLQTEAPRGDGGTGFPGLRLRPDAVGSTDGLAQAPYVRESRRILARQTVREQDISADSDASIAFSDPVGIAHYFIDMWPRTGGGAPYLLPARPAQIPLGALIPVRLLNLLPASKNAGFTQITNSMFRMHAGEWAVGEAAGALATYCVRKGVPPVQLFRNPKGYAELAVLLQRLGIRTRWPRFEAVPTWPKMVETWRQAGEILTGWDPDASL